MPEDRPSDHLIFQHLGAAVMLCWPELPLCVREHILSQSGDVIGLAPMLETRQEIVKLHLRRTKAQWTDLHQAPVHMRCPANSTK
jgi:hypothetical protein